MTDITRFHTEFVERTGRILTEYKGELEWTNLLNCTLGLIVLPNEKLLACRSLKKGIWGKSVREIPVCQTFGLSTFKPVQRHTEGNGFKYYPETLGVFLRKLRNGLVHQRIEPGNDGKTWVSITVRNYFEYSIQGRKQEKLDLEATFTWDQLRAFALFIADEFLKTQKDAEEGKVAGSTTDSAQAPVETSRA
jgi:hypothetical protein